MSSKSAFLTAPLFAAVAVELPGGFTAHVRALPYALLVNMRAMEKGGGLPDEAIPAIVAAALCDEAGRPLFDPDSAEDLDAVGAKPLPALRAILDAAIEASTVDVGAAKKNSPATT